MGNIDDNFIKFFLFLSLVTALLILFLTFLITPNSRNPFDVLRLSILMAISGLIIVYLTKKNLVDFLD